MGCSSSVTSAWLKESPAVLKEVIYSVPLKFGLVIAGSGVSVVNKLRTDIFNSVQSLNRLGGWGGGDMRDDATEILFQYFLQKALVSSSCTGRKVSSLMSSIQHEGWFWRGCRGV